MELDEIKSKIGKRIKDLRIQRTNMNQDDFAKKIGMDRTYLSRIENGKQNTTVELFHMIIKGLNISYSEFFEDFEEEN